MVGAEDLEVPELEAVPQRGSVPRVAQRRGADVLGALETFSCQILVLEGEVLRTCLGVDRLATLVGEVDSLEGRCARDVNDQDRSPGDLGEADGPVRSLGLDRLGTGQGVEAGGCVTSRESLLLQLGDGVPVLSVDQNEDTCIPGELQYLEEVVVFGVQGCSFVGHEDLDRSDASFGEVWQLRLYVVAQVRYGDVETVVYDGLIPGLLGPRVECSGEGASGLLQGEVDEHGRPAGHRGLGARGPVVRRDGAPERHVHVGVGIYETGHNELAGSVYRLGAVRVQVRGDGDYLLVFDEHVGPVATFCGYDRSSTE